MAYIPLDPAQKQIRLLRLAPALNYEDHLICSFSLASFDEDVNYQALSYAWGDTTPIMPVTLEGQEVLITKNLHSALCGLRYRDRQRILWADALCINQTDLLERNHQVSLMSSIYSRATLVVVWLGEAWEGCELVMEMLTQFGCNESLHVFKSLNPGFSIHGMDLRSPELRDHLYRFFSAPWWNRLWTVQEHALASSVVFQYGQHTIDVGLAIMAGRNLYIHIVSRDCCRQLVTEDDKHAYKKIGECIEALWLLHCVQVSKKLRSIIYWISLFASREVTDPRDKVYGLLGLAVGDEIGMVKPDYTSSLEEVFYTAALGSIRRNKNLDVLSYVVGERSDQLPSFVPDWAHQLDFKKYELRLDSFHLFSAAIDTIARVKEIATGKLAVRGIFVDTVIENHFPYETWEEKFEKYQLLFYKGYSASNIYHHTGEPREIAWWITICGGIDLDPHRFEVMFTFWRMRHLKDLSRFRKLESWLKTSTLNESLLTPEVYHVNRLFRNATYGRSLIFTETGYIGLAPVQCQKGDLVAVLAGGKVPYILRPKAASKTPEGEETNMDRCYTVVGDAYIHGIMDGEAVKELEQRDGQMEEVILV